jgi:hypothetical protein
MKKRVRLMLCCLGAASLAFADDWTVVTGRVTKVRQGKAAFYTVVAQSGAEYIANSAHVQVQQNEAMFKEARQTGAELYVEFRSHTNNPGSIWTIRKIELLPVSAKPAE